ncbi:protein kinase (macronuclear) [Tetrahymena thermophila SB210]|uniref:Protein kinase n=1 Tax=Tetrahymena thermophila (strain SB210) TaxID=312017 RepID=I7MCP3_TETTS|nr:protein kinase [Tetrahymena thermophila SB210]EAR84475.1 protein kinase [Tetrahymena thermophila SB210]|eukprot:XP_001032138.1 protein kinase [Tetrahymena thermophila SB210]
MGKSLSKDRNYEEYLLLYRKIESVKDIHYGDIDIMESKDKKQIIAMKDRKFQNLEKLREQLGQIRKRRDNTHPNFIQVLEYFVMSEDNFCTSISRLIWTMEYIKKDLTVEIRQRKLQQIPFDVSEIQQIAFASISAFANLQRDGIYFNDLRAQNILLTNSLEVKILDPVFEPNPPLLIQVLQTSKPKKGTYLAPNYLKFAKQKNIPHKLTTHKSESFSLGFVLMEACLLNEQDECFDFREGTINLENYKKNIQQIEDTYGEEISSMIKEMTNFNEKQRLDFIQLETKYNLNTKLDKPMQSSQFLQGYSSTSKFPTSQSQLKINGDQSISQISHLDQNKKSASQKQIRPLRQFDLLNKNSSKETVNTDRSQNTKEKNYFCKINYQTFQLQKIGSLNVDHKNLPTNNSFVSNAESFIPFIQNLDSHQNLRDKQTPLNKNKFQQQNNISENKQNKQQNNLRSDQAITPRHSISFVHQENFENYNQNTLNVNKQDGLKENDKNVNEFKKNTKLQGQLQNFYSNMRSQNDKSILNNTQKLNAKNKSISQMQNSLLQSMRIDQAGEDKENFNSSNAEILKCLKDESNIENTQDAQAQNQNTSHESVYLTENNLNNQNQQNTPIQQTTNDNTPKRQIQSNIKNKSYDSPYNLFGNNLNPIDEDKNEKYQKSSPQLQISVTADGDMISAIDPQSTTTKQQNNQNQTNNLNSLNKKFFNISEIKFEGNGNQNSNTTNFINTKSSVVPYQTNNQQQSFYNNSHYQTSFIEAQSIYIQQRSNSQVIEVIEETYEDGSVYSGEKFKGKRHGNGKFLYADGGLYEGSWFDGCMEGYGKLYYPSGKLAYEGEWKRDKFTGQGVVYNDTPEELGENQSFDFTDFDKMGEHWIQYEGGFLDDQKQGQGILYLSNGNRFIGGFLNDMVEGIGIFVNQEGKEIKAHYSQNKLLKLL